MFCKSYSYWICYYIFHLFNDSFFKYIGIVCSVEIECVRWEGFNNWNLASSTQLENAHGSAPAGVNASPGRPQYEQDSMNPHVNPMYKGGNPQNVNPEYKKQPGFTY